MSSYVYRCCFYWICCFWTALLPRNARALSLQPPATSIVPPPPPISVPVWSLSTVSPLVSSPRETAVSRIGDDEPDTARRRNEAASTSMNIVTFATPISVSPKLWAVSLYHGTKTKDVFVESGYGVLQLLSQEHKYLVPVLGKHTGYDTTYSKPDECSRAGFSWTASRTLSTPLPSSPTPTLPGSSGSVPSNDRSDTGSVTADNLDTDMDRNVPQPALLPRCPLYICLKMLTLVEDAGDHVVAICQVVDTMEWNEETDQVQSLTKTLSALDAEADNGSVLYTGQLRNEDII